MKCLFCHREVTEPFWIKIRQCQSCGNFLWDKPIIPRPPDDPIVNIWRQLFFYVGFAIEIHDRWIQKPWLTGPICVCHPEIHV